jgi:hypothetical protein
VTSGETYGRRRKGKPRRRKNEGAETTTKISANRKIDE